MVDGLGGQLPPYFLPLTCDFTCHQISKTLKFCSENTDYTSNPPSSEASDSFTSASNLINSPWQTSKATNWRRGLRLQRRQQSSQECLLSSPIISTFHRTTSRFVRSLRISHKLTKQSMPTTDPVTTTKSWSNFSAALVSSQCHKKVFVEHHSCQHSSSGKRLPLWHSAQRHTSSHSMAQRLQCLPSRMTPKSPPMIRNL